MYQLTCRARAEGRGLVPVAPAAGSPDPATAGLVRWTIFVHGFNNSAEDAAATWKATVDQLQAQSVDLGTIVLFYWPGDYSRWEALSAINYPRTVPTAEETARLLTSYVDQATRGLRQPLQLSFVAHSLGSLVVLEAVRLLRSMRANVDVADVLLMAAAVPEGFCVPDETYGNPFSSTVSETVLYSLDDSTLKLSFEVGQEIADRFPENRRRAVGRSGGPGAGRGERWTSSSHMDGFAHGDYWRKPQSVGRIAQVVEPDRSFTARAERAPGPSFTLREDALSAHSLDEAEYLPPELVMRWLSRPTDS